MKLTAEGAQQLAEGISLVLSRWWELQDAVDALWAGPHSHQIAIEFGHTLTRFFCQPNPNRRGSPSLYKLEELLYDGMDSFSLIANETIVTGVANLLMNMYEECLENNYQRIQELRDTTHFFEKKTAPTPRVSKAANISNVYEDNQISSMIATPSEPLLHQEVEGASQAKNLDEAPWVTVASKKLKRKKK